MPEKTKKLFWDVENFSLEEHKRFIIERVLFLGDLNDMKWMMSYYGKDDVKKVAKNSRILRPATRNFFLNVI